MIKAIWDLTIALINATLLLVALCLFLGWQLFSSIDSLTEQLGTARDKLVQVHQNISDIRADLEDIHAAVTSGTALDQQVDKKLSAIDKRIADVQTKVTAQMATIDQTAVATAEAFAASLVRNLVEAFGHAAPPKE